ncbi:uncharacterized protein AMSG_08895 [Thecamonas trahens ATCC 50062]|uniref:Major facilitator superfamily (MFS) profile domain-containing protein n=1 Tax=Thecamonas trahens ATCC 50062 TaxID=461836 RepID=A0A0L0DM94_THETB|nr:hypothetical protein AMSG_08895 [Thecamonas trahens ATCC 50062]KNC53390.1 hypothetical protein AMSG_08895 [Thecamonas trahens ATCC 50062]|eukprot:XP_013754433.1 hypothetical protein AMSG_08895 [Thecamonas trahens ATCC 50062]
MICALAGSALTGGRLSGRSGRSAPPQCCRSVFYGWLIALVCGYQYFLSGPGQTYGVSQFLPAYGQSFGLSAARLSLLYAIATAASGFTLPIMGRVVDRMGVKRASLLVAVAFALVCVFNASLLSGEVTMLLSFYLLRFLGQGSMTLLPKTLLPQWFVEKRGRAFALVNIGSFGGSTVFPVVLTALISGLGWRKTWFILALILLATFVPLVLFVVVDAPEHIGLLPDGATLSHNRTPPPLADQATAALLRVRPGEEPDSESDDDEPEYLVPPGFEISWTRAQAMQTRTFYLLLACNAQRAAVNTAITFFLHPMLTRRGMTDIQAALVLSVQAAVGFPMTLVAGVLADRVPLRYILSATYLTQALFLTVMAYASTVGLAVVAAVLWGIAGGLEQIGFNVVWPNYYGRKHVGGIVSISISVMVLGSAIGPLAFALLRDSVGSYRDAILYIVPLALVCSALAYGAAKPRIRDSGLAPLDFYDDDLVMRNPARQSLLPLTRPPLVATDDSLEEVD